MKTVKLKESYLLSLGHLKQVGGRPHPTNDGCAWCHIVYDAPIPDGTAVRQDDIVNDHTQLPVYNLKTDSLGRLTTDYDSIHSYIPVTHYALDKGTTCEVPQGIFDKFNGKVFEEVV